MNREQWMWMRASVALMAAAAAALKIGVRARTPLASKQPVEVL